MSERVVVVTGAGRGIGRWTARSFAALGDRVALIGLDGDELDAVAAAVKAEGGEPFVFPADLSSPDTPDEAMAAVDARWGRVDVLVNNAARFDHKDPAWDIPLEHWQDILDVNVTGVYLCARAAARLMIRDGRGGRIVNLGAIQQWSPLRGWAAYAASKGAVTSLTRALAIELGPHAILVNAVAPGGVDVRDDEVADDPSATLLGRLGHPREVAEVIQFLASPACTFITGEVIRCDGGRLLLARNDPQDTHQEDES